MKIATSKQRVKIIPLLGSLLIQSKLFLGSQLHCMLLPLLFNSMDDDVFEVRQITRVYLSKVILEYKELWNTLKISLGERLNNELLELRNIQYGEESRLSSAIHEIFGICLTLENDLLIIIKNQMKLILFNLKQLLLPEIDDRNVYVLEARYYYDILNKIKFDGDKDRKVEGGYYRCSWMSTREDRTKCDLRRFCSLLGKYGTYACI